MKKMEIFTGQVSNNYTFESIPDENKIVLQVNFVDAFFKKKEIERIERIKHEKLEKKLLREKKICQSELTLEEYLKINQNDQTMQEDKIKA